MSPFMRGYGYFAAAVSAALLLLVVRILISGVQPFDYQMFISNREQTRNQQVFWHLKRSGVSREVIRGGEQAERLRLWISYPESLFRLSGVPPKMSATEEIASLTFIQQKRWLRDGEQVSQSVQEAKADRALYSIDKREIVAYDVVASHFVAKGCDKPVSPVELLQSGRCSRLELSFKEGDIVWHASELSVEQCGAGSSL